jgi:hypothetical protein
MKITEHRTCKYNYKTNYTMYKDNDMLLVEAETFGIDYNKNINAQLVVCWKLNLKLNRRKI